MLNLRTRYFNFSFESGNKDIPIVFFCPFLKTTTKNKIVCKAVSKVSYNVAEDSALIRIKEEGKVVVPDDHWLENNAWSVVFLSIGSLCLIGIVVLLFIKPKDTEDTKKK